MPIRGREGEPAADLAVMGTPYPGDMSSSRRHEPAPIRITTAGTGPQADIARRQRRYVISMAIRSACFVGAVIAGVAGIGWLWPILIAGAILLPYVAVVMANARTSRTDSLPLTGDGTDHRRLGPHGA